MGWAQQFAKKGINELKISTKSVLDRPELFDTRQFEVMIPQTIKPSTKETMQFSNSDKIAADKIYRETAGRVWQNATEDEKNAIFSYTDDAFKVINRTLRGKDPYTGQHIGYGRVPISTLTKYDIDDITNLISQSFYNFDTVVYRGQNFSTEKFDRFFNTSTQFLKTESEQNLKSRLVDREVKERAFFSTSAIENGGFMDQYPINMRIHIPRNTQMIYTEPFSNSGAGARRHWDGISKQEHFGTEMELLLQRDSSFVINDVQKNNNKLFFDLTLISQMPRKISSREIY